MPLNALATKLAHKLSRLGVGPEVLVPYAFEKSMYAVVATLAVLKAGGAFVPLDFSHPKDRLKSIISRVGATLLLASPKTAPVFDEFSLDVLVVGQQLLDGLPEEAHNPDSAAVKPRNSAFVLFTSGSTGEPKGLVQEHASVCTVNAAYGESLFINEDSRVLNFAAYTFDVSTVDVFTTLYQGGCVCIPSEEQRLNDIVRVINDFRVSWVDLTPSFALAAIPRPSHVPSLKTLVLAGEEVKKEHLGHFIGKIDRVINCYGPAEAGGCLANVYENAASQPQTVGLPLKSARCWIVDPKNPRRLAPIGATGELVIEGPTLARGYLKDASKTDAAFIHHRGWRPIGTCRSRRRFYKTGDLVRYRPDGLINFVGRRDTQAKIRGQRVELTEIEQHLADDVSIKRCLVEFPQSGVYAKRLVAVVQPRLCRVGELRDDMSLSLVPAEELLKSGFSLQYSTTELSKRVPAYMMPAKWLVVASLPLTDSKKVDRRKVRDWLADLSVSDGPNTLIPWENTLALELSRKVSTLIANGNSQVREALTGRTFDLAAVGIDSIQIVTLSIWIHENYRVKLAVDRLTSPGLTIDKLAELVAASQSGEQPDELQSHKLDLRHEVSSLFKLCNKPESEKPEKISFIDTVSTVLLTGGTGFLGIEILRQLLCHHNVNVVVHVRATSVRHGRDRVVAAAKKAAWWSDVFDHRLEIWPGDLSRVKLGLSNEQWDRVMGKTWTPIDAVIHNGATVRWNQAYESLKASNTIATMQLLEAIAKRRSCGRFVYVSGGQVLHTGVDDEELMMTQSMHLTGYAQSKIVSELLVKRFAESETGRRHIIQVLKPSYIIGDAQNGRANEGDYFWRLTRSVIELGAYSRGSQGWLYVSNVDRVAEAVCQICSTTTTTTLTVVKILDGLPVQELWDLLTRDFKYHLEAVDGEEWWSLLRSHVERTGPSHCLWALQHILETGTGDIASEATVPTREMTERVPEILKAIRRNVQYLEEDAKFFPSAASGCRAGEGR
ncbi:hypothetical protein XA68_13375 [Ophiocordyceps unilateralis]|uniref:Carrier domain-containing protein n=1 Tax=Ophiocordyceps unilateralis TaxID=268505 RepID=A0A2A9PNJ0_OPHUN|nr:hypothetical protein XA68_13375 [Ophiocordyceps unilateralis]